jgi:pimeloyl-ACP methyl ester carboxylesterase
MPQLHCISGLGADERIFSELTIPGTELTPLQWILPQKAESIGDYAGRMFSQVHTDHPIFLGVSFGGMMALEMAKLCPGAKVIIVSSVKTHKELPGWMKVSGNLGLNKLLPRKPPRWARLEDDFLGTETEEERLLVREFMKTADPVYLRWAIGQVINWRNEWLPPFLYHLHGSNDRTFPLKNIHATHIVPGGGHFMVMNRAKEVSAIIQSIINQPLFL